MYASECFRANKRLAEANAKLIQERHRSKSLITSSIVSGGLAASPVLYSTELGHPGGNLALNRSLSLGGSFLSPTGNALSSRSRVEDYVAKVSILKYCSQLLLRVSVSKVILFSLKLESIYSSKLCGLKCQNS